MAKEWLERGRKFEQEMASKLRNDIRQTLDDPNARSPLADFLFVDVDPVPDNVRAAAYRVEARRSLIIAVNEFAVAILFILGLAAMVLAVFVSVWFALAVAAIASGAAAWVYWRGSNQAETVVEWHQSTEPLVWALYYPVQFAQRTLAAIDELKARGSEKLSERALYLQSLIEREDSVGRVLPGQAEKFYAFMEEMQVRIPEVLISLQNSWFYAQTLAARAQVVATLVYEDTIQRMRIKGGADDPPRALAQRRAKRAYSWLLSAAERSASLPRLHLEDVSAAEVLANPSVKALGREANRVLQEAASIAQGQWPELVEGWELPRRRAAAWTSAIGAILLAASFLPSVESYSGLMQAASVVLLPGQAGKFAEKLTALRSSKSPSPGQS
jgi:hypothetical protein